ncbi:MAG: YheC/YheD family protein [Candidatus Omnitrophota bacterium]
MRRREKATILVVGDHVDYDSYRKLSKEGRFIRENGFDYRNLPYIRFLNGKFPKVETKKVIIFLFFPFYYWNHKIEHRGYRGVYGDHTFYKKFQQISWELFDIIRSWIPDKEIILVNDPRISAFYRNKLAAMDVLIKNGINIPRRIRSRKAGEIISLLENGHKLFIKPMCGSLGKGMTFLQLGNWQTNFRFNNKKIVSRKADKGWRFREITGNAAFLRSLLKKDVFIEEAVDLLNIKGDKVDFRVYTFFNKVLYIYPRRSSMEAVTTNITQGGKGDPSLLKVIPGKMLNKVKRAALMAAKGLKLNFAGVDVIIDSKMKDVYVVDVNMFPGFPKRRTLNLGQAMIKELRRLNGKGALRYEKGSDI